MRFSLGLPTDRVELGAEFGSARAIREMAGAAEELGFGSVFVTEHPIPGDEWMATGGHHALDPFVALAVAASATETLRLHTNLVVVPYRNPFLLAKSAASLDSLSGGRLDLGLGAGYLEAEFRALGADFEHRNERTDEALELLDRIWTGESLTVSGAGFEATGNHALPRPAQQPRPPLWIGGNSRRAIRRAVAHGRRLDALRQPARPDTARAHARAREPRSAARAPGLPARTRRAGRPARCRGSWSSCPRRAASRAAPASIPPRPWTTSPSSRRWV